MVRQTHTFVGLKNSSQAFHYPVFLGLSAYGIIQNHLLYLLCLCAPHTYTRWFEIWNERKCHRKFIANARRTMKMFRWNLIFTRVTHATYRIHITTRCVTVELENSDACCIAKRANSPPAGKCMLCVSAREHIWIKYSVRRQPLSINFIISQIKARKKYVFVLAVCLCLCHSGIGHTHGYTLLALFMIFSFYTHTHSFGVCIFGITFLPAMTLYCDRDGETRGKWWWWCVCAVDFKCDRRAESDCSVKFECQPNTAFSIHFVCYVFRWNWVLWYHTSIFSSMKIV